MPEVAPRQVERGSPAVALQSAFESIRQGAMRDLPMLHPALAVEAIGFRPWQQHWLGVLVTPWFMNLVVLPRVPEAWLRVDHGESRHHRFPAGVFEFIGARDADLGDYLACSLFSPMFEFVDQASARATAEAVLVALFDPASREVAAPAGPPLSPPPPTPAPAAPVSKRDFLFGNLRRGGDAP
jgi:[NiFe] hydrogenase assembly HybE family chaperone